MGFEPAPKPSGGVPLFGKGTVAWIGRRAGWILGSALACLGAGCGDRAVDQIQTYEVARDVRPRTRMLAAMVRRGETTWFFKLTGPEADVTAEMPAFTQRMRALAFNDRGEPVLEAWKAAGWIEATGNPQRLATFRKATDRGVLDLAVTSLPTGPDWDTYVRDNVNRWRRQLRLEPLASDQLDAHLMRLKSPAGDGEMVLVNFVEASRETAQPPMMSPHASPSPARPSAQRPELAFDLPPGWKRTRNDTFSLYAFVVEDDELDAAARVTVTPLGAMAGRRLLANVNRWRAQLGMPPVDEAGLEKITRPVTILGAEGHLVELVPDGDGRDGILGAVAVAGGRAWFVKMMGTTELLRKEKPTFERFVRSLRWRAPEPAASKKAQPKPSKETKRPDSDEGAASKASSVNDQKK